MGQKLDLHIHRKVFDSSENPSLRLIDNLEFRADAGEIVSIIAPSGAGKTTLLRMISGYDREFEGQLDFGGQRVVGPTRAIQAVDQRKSLIPWKTVAKNLDFALETRSEHDTERIDELLRMVGLLERKTAWPKDLSGGERARAVIARSLVAPPELLLLDEPFVSLDVESRILVHTLLSRVHRESNLTVVMASHRVTDAVILSDRITILRSRPMQVHEEIPIPIDRPRSLEDRKVTEMAAKIQRALISSEASDLNIH